MKSVVLKIISISLTIFVSPLAFGYLGELHCDPADAKSRLFLHATELSMALKDYAQNGDKIVDYDGATPDRLVQYLDQKYILWGKLQSHYVIQPGKRGTPVYLSHTIKLFKSSLMEDVKEMKIEYSFTESWDHMLNRILGEGEFQGQAIVKESDFSRKCSRAGDL